MAQGVGAKEVVLRSWVAFLLSLLCDDERPRTVQPVDDTADEQPSAIAMLREDAMQCWVERLGAEMCIRQARQAHRRCAVGRQTTGHEHWDLED